MKPDGRFRGYIGNMRGCWGYIGIMEKKVETIYSILGLYWDNGTMETT